jgi:palmitoyltransferase ZDHHC9/14/18
VSKPCPACRSHPLAQRNYRFFLLFVGSSAILCCWVFALSIANVVLAAKADNWRWGTAVGHHVAAIVCAAYTFLAFWFVGGLSALHTYLVLTNQTTYEHFRHRYSGGSCRRLTASQVVCMFVCKASSSTG